MHTVRTALLAGAAALAFAGLPVLARAQGQPTPPGHELTVELPGGGTAHIRYSGNIPPAIMFVPAPAALPMGFMPAPFAWDAPFVALDRIAAEMDREAAALLRQAGAMAALPLLGPDRLVPASGFAGNGVCARSLTITARGDGSPPLVISKVAGDCGPASRDTEPAAQPAAPAGMPRPDTIRVIGPATPAGGLVHPVAAWQG
jgi:hypothetical protein